MRLAPAAIAAAPDLDAARALAAAQSRVTHAAPECLDAARLLADILVRALTGASRDDALGGTDPSTLTAPAVCAIAQGDYQAKDAGAIRGTGYVVESLEAALWCVATTDSFETAVLAAANLGDDADTTAAIAGQVAGALYGHAAIPDAWRARLHLGAEIALATVWRGDEPFRARRHALPLDASLAGRALSAHQPPGQGGQDGAERRVGFDGDEGVGAGLAEGDEGDGLALARGAVHEAQAGVDGERRSDDEERVGLLVDRPCGGDRRRGHALAEEDDVGLERPAARRARGHDEGGDGVAVEFDIAVGRGLGGSGGGTGGVVGVGGFGPALHVGAGVGGAAAETDDAPEGTVEFDDAAASGGVVEAVDVLRDHARRHARRFEFGEGAVAAVRTCVPDARPPERRPRPVALPRGHALVARRHEGVVLDRIARAVPRLRPAVVGDAAVGGEPRAREDGDAPSGEHGDEGVEGRVGIGGGRRVRQAWRRERKRAAPVRLAAMRGARCHTVTAWRRTGAAGGHSHPISNSPDPP